MLGFDALGMDGIAMSVDAQTIAPPLDTSPPTAPSSLTLSSITQTSVHVAWGAATDDVGVTGYEISVDSGTPAWVDVGNVLASDVSGLTASTDYTVRSRAYDAAGNRSTAITWPLTTASPPHVTPPSFSSTAHGRARHRGRR